MTVWHASEELVRTYAEGRLDRARAASIEAHVIACAACRALAARASDRDRLDRIWTEVTDAIDRPRRSPFEALLVALGVREHVARLVSATPSLQASWFAAVGLSLSFALAAAHGSRRSVLAFLVFAPLIPLIGVALAYGPRIDPTYEVSVAAPLRGFRLLLIRAGTVVVTSIVLIGAGSLTIPGVGWKAAAWLVPALAVSLVTLALSSWIEPVYAAGVVGFGWIALAVGSPLYARGAPVLDRIVAFRLEGQVAFAILGIVAAVVIAARASHFDVAHES
jgi:hypothetical protein